MSEKPAKKVIGWTITGALLVCLVLVGVAAASIASEAGKLDSMLKEDVSSKKDLAQVQHEVSGMDFKVTAPNPDSEFEAEGPHHRALIYNTWLKLKVTANAEGKSNGYHFDRESSWF